MPKSKRELEKPKNGQSAGLEAKLWAAADALRNNMDAAEYKHVVLGLIFIKYISDAFESKHAELEAQRKDGADTEDPDEYKLRSSKTSGNTTMCLHQNAMLVSRL
jgi:type I restriction enzyme M protein